MKPIFIISIISLIFGCSSAPSEDVAIVPQPNSISTSIGCFNLSKDVKISIVGDDATMDNIAEFYRQMIENKINLDLAIVHSEKARKNGSINLIIDDNFPDEGYAIEVTTKKINIKASKPAGMFYAMQSLNQMMNKDGYIQTSEIKDEPRFAWRGMMLDVARHFYNKEYVFKFIDLLSYHKMNKLHLHLTDGIGWRIQIDKYPELTAKGAYRKITPYSKSWENFELYDNKSDINSGNWYGGYFTKEDIREIVRYAGDRFIEVIPEIEMPGHSMAALACYPQFTCTNSGIGSDVYCAGNDQTFEFLSNIIAEVTELFPSKYIHVGGDEVGKEQWMNCPKCKLRLKNEGLANGEELQSYFMKRMEKYISSLGKQMMGWDEILQGGLPPSATVMSWTGFEGGIKAANEGHDVIMVPMSHCYFDHYQGNNNHEPQGWGGYTSVEKVYSFEPIPDQIASDKRQHILGGQANIWTETISSPSHIEYMVLPRLTALSEVLWSRSEDKDWAYFKTKLDKQFDHYREMGYNYSESALTPFINTELTSNNTLTITADTELGGYPIHYTLDDSEVNPSSPQYTEPLNISECATLRLATFRNGEKVGYEQDYDMLMNKATGAKVTYEYPYNTSYSGGGDNALVDNKFAMKRGDSPFWQGVEQNDFNVVIDLGSPQDISTIKLSYFQHLSTTSVVLPTEINVYNSDDGSKYTLLESIKNIKELNRDGIIKTFYIEKPIFTSQYIKVTSKNIGILPKGYNRAGSKAWVFMDEIAIN